MTPSRRAVVVSDWDRQRFTRMELGPDGAAFALEGEALRDQVGPTAGALWADLFALCDRATPELVPAEDMDAEYLTNRRTIATLAGLPELARLKRWTTGDAAAAAEAAIALRPTLAHLYDRYRLEARLATDRAAAQTEKAPDLEPPDLETLLAHHHLRQAVAGAADGAERMAALFSQWSGDPGQMQRTSFTARRDLARRLNTQRFALMAELFGGLQRLISRVAVQRPAPVPTELNGITHGRDLSRMVASTMVEMADPLRGAGVAAALAEGRLPIYDHQALEPAGRGGMVVAVDTSSSMVGGPEALGKATALTLLHLARRQGRSFWGILFSSGERHRGSTVIPARVSTFDFSGRYKLEAVIDYIELFYGGGTDWEAPLRSALGILGDQYDRHGWPQGDVVLVTDGLCNVGEATRRELRAEAERIGAKVWGVAVGELGAALLPSLRRLCDHVVHVADVMNPSLPLEDILAGLSDEP